jgi:hypothetical protein
MVPEFKQTEIKEVLVKKKRIIYEIKGSDINILAVAPERMALVNIDADWIWPDL